MKKFLQYLVVSLFIPQANLLPQSPIVQQVIDSVNIDSLIYFIEELSGEVSTIVNGTPVTILSRHRDQPGNALAETYIKQKLESYGLPVTIQNCSATANNVLATQVGTIYPNKKFIIGAHYDSMPAGTNAPGADDNATGTAAVIEAARILTQHTFPYTIIYALWDEHETLPYLVGSNYYASQALASGDSIIGVLDLTQLGSDSNNDGICNVRNEDYVHTVQIIDNLIEINNQYGINLNIIKIGMLGNSDHSYFLYNGYDAVGLHEDLLNDRSPYYHTVNDRVQYLNQPYFLKMTKLALATLTFHALYLNFDLVYRPVAKVIPTEPTNTNLLIYTAKQIGAGSLAPRIYYRTKAFGSGTYGDFNEVIGTPTGGRNYTFDFPEFSDGTSVQYYIAAQDENSTIIRTLPSGGSGFNPPGNIPPTSFYEFLVADLEEVWLDSANYLANWTATGQWNTTTEKFASAPTSFTDSPGGNYPPNTFSTLTSKNPFQVSTAAKTYLEFDTQWLVEYGDNIFYDYAQLQISTNNGLSWIPLRGQYTHNGGVWVNYAPYYGGLQATWVHEILDITNYANNPFKIRFVLYSDYAIFLDGWYIDNVRISVFNDPTDIENFEQLPVEYALSQNYPNPFNPLTKIEYQIPEISFVELKVYDVIGNEIKTLINEEKQIGNYEVEFDATGLSSGVYFYQLKTGEFISSKKMVLIK